MSAYTVGDLRSAALEQRRNKEHRVKYRGVNVNLLGKPISDILPNTTIRNSTTWNAKNKFRMRDTPGKTCHCSWCRKHREQRKDFMIGDVTCNTPSLARKSHRPKLNSPYVDDLRDLEQYGTSSDEEDLDACVNDVVYSFDHAGPGRELDLSHAVTQAVEKFENKQLATLVKNEYEFVEEDETDEEFELI